LNSIFGCSEENTAKPKLRNTRRLHYIYFLCYFYNYFTVFHLTQSLAPLVYTLGYFYNAKKILAGRGGPPGGGGPHAMAQWLIRPWSLV